MLDYITILLPFCQHLFPTFLPFFLTSFTPSRAFSGICRKTRCRHGLGTYYPELEDINHYNNEENDVADYGRYDRAHIENMVQRYKRLAIGSIDPENVARYRAKLEEWERKQRFLTRHLQV